MKQKLKNKKLVTEEKLNKSYKIVDDLEILVAKMKKDFNIQESELL